jgi:protein-tyrosine phosphatase
MTADPMPAFANFRDLGGLPTDDGRFSKVGVLYRSDAPLPGDQPPPELPWPPRAVIDLRSASEVGQSHPLSSPNTVVIQIDLLGWARPKTLAELKIGGGIGLGDLYQDLIRRVGDVATAVLELLLEGDGPLLVHCAAGKDRTGVLIALLLRAAGVTREAVIADYVLTATAMHDVRRRLYSTDADMAALMAEFPDALAAPAEAIGVVLDHVDATSGGACKWLTDKGVSPDLVSRWRDRFVVPAYSA